MSDISDIPISLLKDVCRGRYLASFQLLLSSPSRQVIWDETQQNLYIVVHQKSNPHFIKKKMSSNIFNTRKLTFRNYVLSSRMPHFYNDVKRI